VKLDDPLGRPLQVGDNEADPWVQMLWGGRRGQGTIVADKPTECPMPQANDLSRCLVTLEQDKTVIAVIEMS
jgi:hypothetical protein